VNKILSKYRGVAYATLTFKFQIIMKRLKPPAYMHQREKINK